MASQIEGHVLRLIANTSQTEVAKRMGIDNSTLSHWLASPAGLARACSLLSALGLRVVDENTPIHSSEFVDSLVVLARHALDRRSR